MQVSAEAPSFNTAEMAKELRVYGESRASFILSSANRSLGADCMSGRQASRTCSLHDLPPSAVTLQLLCSPRFDGLQARKQLMPACVTHVYPVFPSESPKITSVTGRLPNKVGDLVIVNCTSSKSKPAQVLRWYVNDNLVDPSKVSSGR